MDWILFPQFGLNDGNIAAALLRVAVGLFFAISGYHKLFNPERHRRFTATLKADHVPFLGFNQWWVAGWEFAGGILLALGVFTVFMAGVLAIICAVACWAEARDKVASYKPIDGADVVDDYLYLPEVLYLVMLFAIAFMGAGRYSVDYMIWKLLVL